MSEHGTETGPLVASGLAPPVQPLVENPHRRAVELPQARVIPVEPEVSVVAVELLVQLPEEIAKPTVPVGPTPLGVPAPRSPQALPRGASLQVWSPRAIRSPAAFEAQEVEGGRSPLRPTWCPGYASHGSVGALASFPTRNPRYEWLARPCSEGTLTLPEAPSFAWRTDD